MNAIKEAIVYNEDRIEDLPNRFFFFKDNNKSAYIKDQDVPILIGGLQKQNDLTAGQNLEEIDKDAEEQVVQLLEDIDIDSVTLSPDERVTSWSSKHYFHLQECSYLVLCRKDNANFRMCGNMLAIEYGNEIRNLAHCFISIVPREESFAMRGSSNNKEKIKLMLIEDQSGDQWYALKMPDLSIEQQRVLKYTRDCSVAVMAHRNVADGIILSFQSLYGIFTTTNFGRAADISTYTNADDYAGQAVYQNISSYNDIFEVPVKSLSNITGLSFEGYTYGYFYFLVYTNKKYDPMTMAIKQCWWSPTQIERDCDLGTFFKDEIEVADIMNSRSSIWMAKNGIPIDGLQVYTSMGTFMYYGYENAGYTPLSVDILFNGKIEEKDAIHTYENNDDITELYELKELLRS